MVLLELWQALPVNLQRRLTSTGRLYSKYKFLVLRFDRRTGFFSAAMPMAILLGTTIAAGTAILDKQMEIRYWRRQSVSERELQQQEQREQLFQFLQQTVPPEELDNSVPLPGK
ncbi:uncharacterized protein LOC113147314 [Cyclospora cayetanensis]|uniref:Uncharacterized protein LOC113147314 n=1 Tax=Cyclospora cayetanensis TaxID=88456 RepID=A0A6P6RZF5_9EIME|nr:uncharacterized protein LOC113147314 [Cyclospora cayetanensis]